MKFDDAVRNCFEKFTGLHPYDKQWIQATLATKVGGLGLRSLSKHSPAAYLASRSCCFSLCQQIDPQHIWEISDPSSAAYRAATQVNVLSRASVVISDPVPSNLQQRVLSSSIDTGTLKKLTDPLESNLSFRAHLSLLNLDGAGTWLYMPK